MIDLIRALQRPVVIVVVIGLIAYFAVSLVGRFADAEMAKMVVAFVLGSGSIIVGILFGERAAKRKEDK